jgi:hypothetical protein
VEGPRRGGGGYLAVLVAGDGGGVGAELRGVAAGLAAVLGEGAEGVVEGVEGDLELGGNPDEGGACGPRPHAHSFRWTEKCIGMGMEDGNLAGSQAVA